VTAKLFPVSGKARGTRAGSATSRSAQATMRRAALQALVGAAAVCLGGCGLGAEDGSAPLTMLDNFHAIEPGQAYRSAQLDRTSLASVLGEREIRTVINLRGENPGEAWYDAEQAVCAALDVQLVDVPMSARELPPRETLLKLYDAFMQADYPILIHCQAGADRAGAASALWRMTVLGDSRWVASQELSPLYGYFVVLKPAMTELVAMFVPEREWIENEYPAPRGGPGSE
jgi:protein tyrosine phosphatase (PTP) superfamily phosphohydrolase (DUF442 family)